MRTLQLLVLALLATAGTVFADPFTFTTISTITEAPLSNAFSTVSSAGTVAFLLDPFGGVFAGNGGPLTTIAVPSNDIYDFLPRVYSNSQGTVAFTACGAPPGCPQSVYSGNGGALTTVVGSGGKFISPGVIGINNGGTVLFGAFTSISPAAGGIFTIVNGLPTTIADTSDFRFIGPSAINNAGVVAFAAGLKNGGQGIFTNTGGVITEVISTGPLTQVEGLSINDSGTIAFQANSSGGGEGIFTETGGTISPPVALTGNLFEGFSSFSLNDNGAVAFSATVYDGSSGIFLSPAPGIVVPVALKYQQLDGLYVSGFGGFGKQALNDSNQISFSSFLYTVVAGTVQSEEAIFRADPSGCLSVGDCPTWGGQLPATPTTLPEPSALLLLATVMLLVGVIRWRALVCRT